MEKKYIQHGYALYLFWPAWLTGLPACMSVCVCVGVCGGGVAGGGHIIAENAWYSHFWII